jgi:ubiquinone/menaquinone biosynthesis C-methylase UbiE
VLGCGNSTLSRDLRNAGFKSVTSIDYSPTVISKMQQKYQDDNDLHWLVSDMRDMSNIGTAKYDLVIEKGALDAFMAKESNVWEPALEVCVDVGKALTEIRRVMKPGGLYIQISFQQPHFRKRYLAVKVDPTDLSNYDC